MAPENCAEDQSGPFFEAFESSLRETKRSPVWKEAQVVAVHKKKKKLKNPPKHLLAHLSLTVGQDFFFQISG